MIGTVDLERRIELLEKRVFGGFTRKDVKLLRAYCMNCHTPEDDALMLDLANRIEAKLPPEVS